MLIASAFPTFELILSQSRNTFEVGLGVVNAGTFGDTSAKAALNQFLQANGMPMGLLYDVSVSQCGNSLIPIGVQAIGELVNKPGSELA